VATKKTLTPIPTGETVDVSRDTLERTPGRLLDLLRAIGTRPAIFAALQERGYSQAEHQRGWSLIHAATGFEPTTDAQEIDADVTAATDELDEADEDIHAVVDASLRHRVPAAHAALLGGITPGTGAESVLYIGTLLYRIRALEEGTLPDVEPADAAAALDVLAKRGLHAQERARLAKLVERAQAPASTSHLDPERAVKLDAALRAARAFFEEWSEIARIAVKRRDHLILMGLANRRASRTGEDEQAAVVVAPPPAAPAPVNGALPQ
jgi:hypothetical protein